MDFGSFENTIDKNIETDKASDKFDQQLQALLPLLCQDAPARLVPKAALI